MVCTACLPLWEKLVERSKGSNNLTEMILSCANFLVSVCSVKVWDMETFRSIHTYRGHTDQINCVARHPSDECLFLTASRDGTICFWDIRKPKPASRLGKSYYCPLIFRVSGQ